MSDMKAETKATGLLSTFVGFAFTAVAVGLAIPVGSMLLFARDSRDVTGGVAGGIVVLILLAVGLVLTLREKTPAPLLRGFYLLMGGMGLIVGTGLLVWVGYRFLNAQDDNYRAIPTAFLFGCVGFHWLGCGFEVKQSSPVDVATPPPTDLNEITLLAMTVGVHWRSYDSPALA